MTEGLTQDVLQAALDSADLNLLGESANAAEALAEYLPQFLAALSALQQPALRAKQPRPLGLAFKTLSSVRCGSSTCSHRITKVREDVELLPSKFIDF